MATPAKPTTTVLKTNQPAVDPHPELTEELLGEARLRQQDLAGGEKSCGGVKGCSAGDKKGVAPAPVAHAKPAGEKSCSGAKGCSGDKK